MYTKGPRAAIRATVQSPMVLRFMSDSQTSTVVSHSWFTFLYWGRGLHLSLPGTVSRSVYVLRRYSTTLCSVTCIYVENFCGLVQKITGR